MIEKWGGLFCARIHHWFLGEGGRLISYFILSKIVAWHSSQGHPTRDSMPDTHISLCNTDDGNTKSVFHFFNS